MNWLDQVAGVAVERIEDVRRSFQACDTTRPPRAVMHTTEGGWDGSLSVFRTSTGTPTFMIGRDGGGRLRIAQFMPIGEMALTLKNAGGGVETNRWARAQIELVGFSKRDPWLPDDATARLLAALMVEIKAHADVPLSRGGDGTRSVSRWTNRTGWFGHDEVPENDHWDPGALRWEELFRLAGEGENEVQAWVYPFIEWYVTDRRSETKPSGVPSPVPSDVMKLVGTFERVHRDMGPPKIYQTWRNWRLLEDGNPDTRPDGIPVPFPNKPLMRWWPGNEVDLAFAKTYAEKTLGAKLADTEADLRAALGKFAVYKTGQDAWVAELLAKIKRAKEALS